MNEQNEKFEKKTRQRAEGTRAFHVAGFPIDLAEDWNMDCKESFGDCRWVKMWNDHLRAKDYKHYQFVLNKIKALEEKVDELENSIRNKGSSESEGEVKTFRGTLK